MTRNAANNTSAINVLAWTLDYCAAIRRDFPWAKGSDAADRHEAALRGFEADFAHYLIPGFARAAADLIATARADAARVF